MTGASDDPAAEPGLRVPFPTPEPPSELRRVDSVVVLDTGDGTGKSTAAFGVMVRGWARGWRVGVVQFMKSGDWKVGERKLAEHLCVDWWTLGDGFTWEAVDLDESAAKNVHAWTVARGKTGRRGTTSSWYSTSSRTSSTTAGWLRPRSSRASPTAHPRPTSW